MYQCNYSEKEVKRKIRSLLLTYLPKRKYNRAVSLPCLNFDLETSLRTQGYIVDTIESNEDIYKQQIQICTDKKIHNYNSTAASFFTAKIRHTRYYDIAYLDFCCQLNREVLTSLSFSNATVVGLTLLMSRDVYATHLLKIMTRDEYYAHIFEINGYKILDKVKYLGGFNSSMCTFILTKI